MKQLLILSILFLTVCMVDTSFAQRTENKLMLIKFDKDMPNFADPFEAVVIPGDTVQFETVDGDFAIYIENAISILYTENVNLKLELTQSKTQSDKYIVRKVVNEIVEKPYSIFCTTTKNWPKDAPPKIIVNSTTQD